MALARFRNLKDASAMAEIRERLRDEDPRRFFIRRLSEGVARIAAAFFPKPVIVRTSDFKTNEYARLVGGAEFEPVEENPMLGLVIADKEARQQRALVDMAGRRGIRY
jgi:pyruvate,water dikinase